MLPYYLEIENDTGLYQLNDGRYQLIKKGRVDPVMVGFGYVLVEDEVATYFQSLGIERVRFEPAVIWDRSDNSEYPNYQRMIVNHRFSPSEIDDIDLDGKQFLVMDNQYLFASPELKALLEQSSFGFQFSLGLSQFG